MTSHAEHVAIAALLLLLALAPLLLLGPASTLAATTEIIVDVHGFGDFTLIQDAIDAADPGDTILIRSGTYDECIDVNKTLILTGDPADPPILGSYSGESIVQVSAPDCTLEGLHIGYSSSIDIGIRLLSVNTTIENCTLSDVAYGVMSGGGYFPPGLNGTTIDNCTFLGDSGSGYEYGISIVGVYGHDITITHDRFDGFAVACEMGFYNISSGTIAFNNITDTYDGLLLYQCNDLSVHHNTIRCMDNGIYLGMGERISVVSNEIDGGYSGIDLGDYWSDSGPVDSVLDSNTCTNCEETGIRVQTSCNNLTITRNRCEHITNQFSLGTGIEIVRYWGGIDGDGGANGNGSGDGRASSPAGPGSREATSGRSAPMRSHTIRENICRYNDIGISVSNGSHVIDSNTASQNGYYGIYVISTNITSVSFNTCEDNMVGIEVINCTLADISSDWLFGNGVGIRASHSDMLDISDCVVRSNSMTGIELTDVSSSLLDNDTCTCSSRGILLDEGSGCNNLTNNKLTSNDHGIYLMSSHRNRMEQNQIEFNRQNGISLSHSDSNLLTNNSMGTNRNGLEMSGSFNTVHHNLFNSNIGYAVSIMGAVSRDNRIYLNDIISNNGVHLQASDTSFGPNWFNCSDLGNHWDDWTTPDSNGDGIVDYPYYLDGDAGTRDLFPLTDRVGWPRIVTTDIVTCMEDVLYSVPYRVVDIDNTSLQWTFKTDADWLNFRENNTLSGTPDNGDVGIYDVEIGVSDGMHGDVHNFTVEVVNVNDAPNITTIPFPAVPEDTEYRQQFEAEDIDPTDDRLTWSVDTDADFLVMNEITGMVLGYPDATDIGLWEINISVNDGRGGIDRLGYTLEVVNVNDPPVGHDRLVEMSEDGAPVNISLGTMFTDEDSGELAFFIHGISMERVVNAEIITGGTIILTPLPNFNGVEVINIIASDGLATINASLKITVLPVNDPPTNASIHGMADGDSMKAGTALDLTCIFSDVDSIREGDRFTYNWSSNRSGIIGQGRSLRGAMVGAGHHNITLIITDKGGLTTSAWIRINVTAPSHTISEDGVDNSTAPAGSKSMLWLYFLLLVVVVLIAIVGGIVVLKRRTHHEEVEMDEPEVMSEDFEITDAHARVKMYTYYELLVLPRDASAADIKKRYREMSKQLHPDVVGSGDGVMERMVELNNAKEILLDEERRAAYDRLIKVREEGKASSGKVSGRGTGSPDMMAQDGPDMMAQDGPDMMAQDGLDAGGPNVEGMGEPGIGGMNGGDPYVGGTEWGGTGVEEGIGRDDPNGPGTGRMGEPEVGHRPVRHRRKKLARRDSGGHARAAVRRKRVARKRF